MVALPGSQVHWGGVALPSSVPISRTKLRRVPRSCFRSSRVQCRAVGAAGAGAGAGMSLSLLPFVALCPTSPPGGSACKVMVMATVLPNSACSHVPLPVTRPGTPRAGSESQSSSTAYACKIRVPPPGWPLAKKLQFTPSMQVHNAGISEQGRQNRQPRAALKEQFTVCTCQHSPADRSNV
eukprot:COSAG01_NODE_5499_length_4223_cov_1.280310_2_plen_181_part_00